MIIELVDFKAANVGFKDELLHLISKCSEWLIVNHNAHHWQKYYIEHWDQIYDWMVNHEQVFIIRDSSSSLIGCIAISRKMPVYFRLLHLTDKVNADGDDALYISTLAVHPDYHGKRIASKLMEHGENIARLAEVSFVRLDTREGITRISGMYRNRGYEVITNYFEDSNGTPTEYSIYQLTL